MAYIRLKGVIGKVYVPDEAGPKKHPCKDCFCCQWCSDSRCKACGNRKESCKKKRKK